jgi:hypothetical protein
MSKDRIFLMQRSWLVAVIVLAVTAVACGGGEAPEPEVEEMEMTEPEAEAESMDDPRVFFVAPRDGEEISVDVPLAFEFGMEGFEIGAVPETVEQVREGVGHYHLGVDAECLPAGEIVPQAAPWIHFGDGSNTIEMSLEPGEHTFSVQMADDEHRTIEGLCETISVMLEEGI